MALTAGQRIGPYVVERVLPTGQGGFAQVVLARDLLERGELVAVKVQRTRGGRGTHASTAFEAALSNEVEILRRVQHPGIVRIVPIPIDPDRPIYMARDLTLPGMPWYFAMEYLAGGTLEELIQREGRLEPAMAAEIVAQVSAALAYLHRQGIAHLDVKPRNIMLRQPLMPGQAPQVVLGDLGMAQDAALSAEVEGGSIEYLAPERLPLLDGQPVPDAPQVQAAADVYALGVTLYFMLTGRMPYRGSRQRLLRAIRWEQPVLPELHGDDDPALCSLALAMLNKAPELRPSAEMVGWQVDRIVPPPRVWVPRGLSRGDQGAPALPSRKVSHSTVGRGAVGPDTERFKKTTADGRPAPRQKRFLRTAVIVLAVFSMLLLTGYVVATSLVDTSPSSGTEEMAVPGRTHTLAPTGGLTVAALGAAVIGQAAARSASATPKALPADASPLSVVGNEPASTLPLQLRWQYAGTLSQGQEFEV
ncbi:MAG: serine/threonine-protein kinase, partial [Anaerolineales bacterium]